MLSDEKQRFLVCYDYGTGGLWGIMLARSKSEIGYKYPELAVISERPAWLDDNIYKRIEELETHDIDGTPRGLLNALLADRER